MRWIRVLFGAVVAAVITASGVVVTAPVAEAAWRNGVCESNDFCVWKGTSQSGGMRDLPNAVLAWSSVDASFVNQDSSWRNRFSQPVRVYNGSSYGGGTEICVPPGVEATAGVLSTWDDDGQSNHNVSSCYSSLAAAELAADETRLARRCVTASGFAVQPPDPPLDPELEPAGLALAPADPAAEKAWDALPAAQRRAVTTAMFGDDADALSIVIGDRTFSTNTGGCLSSVRTELYGDLATHLRSSQGWEKSSLVALARARTLVQSNETPWASGSSRE